MVYDYRWVIYQLIMLITHQFKLIMTLINNKKINQFTLYSPQTDYEQFEQIVFELKKEIGLTMRLLTEFVNKSNVEKFNKIN